jgi:hypothetical protein
MGLQLRNVLGMTYLSFYIATGKQCGERLPEQRVIVRDNTLH